MLRGPLGRESAWRSAEALGTPTARTKAISLLFMTATVHTKIPLNMSVVTTFLKTKMDLHHQVKHFYIIPETGSIFGFS